MAKALPPLLLLLWMLPAPANAEKVKLTLSSGTEVNAEYMSGERDRPALLVLHGFLQTQDFLSTQMLLEGLAAQGYTVLGPNLSLGVTNRQQSMQCEAAHKHTLAQDVGEIQTWVKWLRAKGHRRVIVVGHSWGSQHALAFASRQDRSQVTAVIAVSLTRTGVPDKVRQAQMRKAAALLQKKDNALHPYHLSFCKKYMATAESYLAYGAWDDDKVIQTVRQLHESGFPVYAILGSADNRIDDAWLAQLRGGGARVSIVEGANHFFASVHEFELIDLLQALLDAHRAGS